MQDVCAADMAAHPRTVSTNQSPAALGLLQQHLLPQLLAGRGFAGSVEARAGAELDVQRGIVGVIHLLMIGC